MEDDLKDINSLMGVVGSFVCGPDGDLIAHAMPEPYDAERLSLTAHVISRTLQALDASGQRTTELDLLYDGGRLIFKTSRSATLAVLCTRNINVPLLNMTANVAIKKIAAQLKPSRQGSPRAPASVEPAPPATPPTAAEGMVQPEELLAPPLFQELYQEACRILEEARRFRIDLRLMDSVAIWASSTQSRRLLAPLQARELWLAGRSVQNDAIPLLFEGLGYQENKPFNAAHGKQRLHFVKPDPEFSVDLMLDNFAMYHRLDLLGYLSEGELTLIETPLLLTRLQLVEIDDAGLRDICALLIEHDLSVGAEKGKIDASAITRLCADDWGWFKTVSVNLDRVGSFAGTTLPPPDRGIVQERIQRLRQSVASAPKSLRWQTRARLGETARWYETPIIGHRTGRPDMAIG